MKKNRNRVKPTGFGWVRFFRAKTGSNRFGSVFRFWLGFFQFCSVFPVWLGFFSGFFRFWFGFLLIKPKPNRTGRFFQKFNRFFFSVRFFQFFFLVFRFFYSLMEGILVSLSAIPSETQKQLKTSHFSSYCL